MEDHEFDALTKRLASPVSRRTAVKAAVATAVGGVFALGKVAGAGAAFSQTCKCNGQPCFVDSQCCSGKCNGTLNGAKVCECAVGTTACQGPGAVTSCVPNCTGGQVLNSTTCKCACPTATTTCVSNGATTCLACTGGAVPNGTCTVCVCPSGTTSCTANGTTNCLACGVGTVPNQTCTTCVLATGATCTANSNCPSGQTCQNGTCCRATGATCSGNSDCCSGTCCQGTCCASGEACLSNGTCARPCSSGCISPSVPDCSCFPEGYCANEIVSGTPCSTDANCPKGQFCNHSTGFCAITC